MEFSIKEVKEKTKQALLIDERIKDLYIDVYNKIFMAASEGYYELYYKGQDMDNLDKLITLFKIDGFVVTTPLSSDIVVISWR